MASLVLRVDAPRRSGSGQGMVRKEHGGAGTTWMGAPRGRAAETAVGSNCDAWQGTL